MVSSSGKSRDMETTAFGPEIQEGLWTFPLLFEEKVVYLSRKHTGGLFQKVYYGPLFNSYQ